MKQRSVNAVFVIIALAWFAVVIGVDVLINGNDIIRTLGGYTFDLIVIAVVYLIVTGIKTLRSKRKEVKPQ